MRTRSLSAYILLAGLIAALPSLAGDSTPLVLEYSVMADDQKVGWSKAVIDDSASGKSLVVTMNVDTEVLGLSVQISSKTSAKYDAQGRISSFKASHRTFKGDVELVGKRSKGGFSITRTKDGKTEKEWIKPGSFDHVSDEAEVLTGDPGTKKKLRVLFTASGKVRKVTITILERVKKVVAGKERTVIHYKLSSSRGNLDEWRTEDGIIVKTQISTPMGKLRVKLID